MIEIKELMVPCVAIFALLFAVFAFLFPRALELTNQKRSMFSKVEVPDSIRKRWQFKIGAFGDAFLLYLVSMGALLLGAIYCPHLLYRIVNYYSGSTDFSGNQILGDFSDLTLGLAILAILILVAAMAILANDLFVSERYPTLVKVYVKDILNVKAKDEEIGSLLPEAHTLFDKGKYLESILHSTAALEHAIRSELGMAVPYRWSNLTDKTLLRLGPSSIGKLERIRSIRNNAVHSTPNRTVTEKESKEVLEVVDELMKQLLDFDQSANSEFSADTPTQ